MSILESINQAWFLHLNAPLGTAEWKLHLAAVAADDLIYVIPCLLVGLWCWGDKSQREAALKACLVTAFALGVNQVLGLLWPHPRPFMMGIGHTFIAHANDSSFPSDHGTVFSVIGLTLLFTNSRSPWGWLILAVGICVAWARIFLGVHFPFDMAGAVLVALAACFTVSPIWRRWGNGVFNQATRLYAFLFAQAIALGWTRP